MPDPDLDGMVQGTLQAQDAAVARALACIEDTRQGAFDTQCELLTRLEDKTPSSHAVLGLTGPPGVGKSTLASVLIRHWVGDGARVGMIAIDPSSRTSGGALLGDRARLRFPPEDHVFIRSMATHDRLGGLAPATRAALTVLRAGFDWTLVETVGVGQSEIDVASVADTVVLMLQPGSGDVLQFMKAGILEIPDLLVVHKWDLGELARRTLNDLEAVLSTGPDAPLSWTPARIGVSSQTRDGIGRLIEAIGQHRIWLEETGEAIRRRARSRAAWVMELFTQRYGSWGIERLGGSVGLRQLVDETPGGALEAFSELATRAGLGA